MTSTMEPEQPIHINISKTNETENKYSAFKEYLIINNLDLQNEVKQLKNDINVLQIEINEKEIAEDKADASIRYLRSLVNNLNEIKKSYVIISKDREHLVNDITSSVNNILKINEKFHLQLLLYNVMFGITNIIYTMMSYSKFRYILTITINILTIYAIGAAYMNYYNNNICKCKKNIKSKKDTILVKIKDIEKELFKLEESTLALDNWIYEV